jgi:hypothetical protein
MPSTMDGRRDILIIEILTKLSVHLAASDASGIKYELEEGYAYHQDTYRSLGAGLCYDASTAEHRMKNDQSYH